MVNCNQTPEMLKTQYNNPEEYSKSSGSLSPTEVWYPEIERDSDQSLLNKIDGCINKIKYLLKTDFAHQKKNKRKLNLKTIMLTFK